MHIEPITLAEARAFIAEHHRHNGAPIGWLFGVAVVEERRIRGVGIASRPTARALDDGYTVEILRVCTLGDRNTCSMVYGRLGRAAKALGYRRLVTYTLASEDGASVRASGFGVVADLRARDYHGGRDRYEHNLFGEPIRPPEAKRRWERSIG